MAKKHPKYLLKYGLALLFALFAFQLYATQASFEFTSFQKLSFSNDNCITPGIPEAHWGKPFYAQTLSTTLGTSGKDCVSDEFSIDGNTLAIEHTGSSNITGKEVFLTQADTTFYPSKPLNKFIADTWTRIYFDISEADNTKNFKLTLAAKDNQWLAVRQRASSFTNTNFIDPLGASLSTPYRIALAVIISLIIAWLLFAILSTQNLKPNKWLKNTLLFTPLVALIHFRSNLFYYWDEWDAIARLAQSGFSAVLKAHNEHFLPLFFASYYGQVSLFGDFYAGLIVVSILIHACNSALIYMLLCKLADLLHIDKRVALYLSILFLLCSFSTELLHWAFGQAITLSATTTLIALNFAFDFISTGRKRHFIIATLAAFSTPFFFGNGFIVIAYLLAFALIPIATKNKGSIKRTIMLAVPTLILLGVAAMLYSTQKNTGSSAISNPLEHIEAIGLYIFTGGAFGTMLRGVGLFPSLGLTAVHYIYPGRFLPYLSAEIGFAWLGLLLGLLAAALGLYKNNKKLITCSVYAAGLIIIFSTFILPSLGRWQLGLTQSLALRYHYTSMIGLCIFLLPFMRFIVVAIEKKSENKIEAMIASTAKLLLLLSFTTHIFLNMTCDYYTKAGSENQQFVAELSHWKETLNEEFKKEHNSNPSLKPPNYTGIGTTVAGLQPNLPRRLNPGHPDKLYRVLLFLRGEQEDNT
jgi:hypothetical protein